MRQKDMRLFLLAPIVALTLSACGDKKGGPPDDEGDGLTQKAACDGASFAECARQVLVNSGLLELEKEELSGCKFDAAQSHGTPADQFEVAKQAVKRTCE